tara:strand:+ start:535 stop:771 length:237 start_codon:yes stop_codon:yes gene_type:complete
MKNFNQLVKEGFEGSFTVEPNELTEIHVNWEKQNITIDTYRTKKKHYTTLNSITKFGQPSFMGGKSLEELFNEAIEKF